MIALEELYLYYEVDKNLPASILGLNNLKKLSVGYIKNGADLQLLNNLPSLKELRLVDWYLDEDSPIYKELTTMKLNYNVIAKTPFEITCFEYYPALIRDRIVLPLRY